MCDETNYDDVNEVESILSDILSSGYGQEFSSWHQKECKEVLDKCSDTIKKEVFDIMYGSDNGCLDNVTIEEIKWFMCECGVNELKLTLNV